MKLLIVTLATLISVIVAHGQSDIQIKKKTSFVIPGMPAIAGTERLSDRPSTVYIKAGRMRTDMQNKRPTMLGKTKTEVYTNIIRCDLKRMIQFNDQKKKYFAHPMSGTSPSGARATKGGNVVVSGKAIDTGERMKLFGLDARRLKQTLTITPGPNACQKETLKIEIDGWYADIPEVACPLPRNPKEFRTSESCFDEVEFDVSGYISGVPLKEVKTMTMKGMSMQIIEEATEVTRTTLADSLFDPPANYRAANTLKEVEDDSPDDTGSAASPLPIEQPPGPGLAPPSAGVAKSALGAKRSGVIRIGLAQPAAQLEKSAYAFVDEIEALRNSIRKYLGGPTVEIVVLDAMIPAQIRAEADQKQCDFVLTANFTQKRGGGGLFGKLPIPGMTRNYPTPGQMPAPGAEASAASLSGNTRSKDKFLLEYIVAPPGQSGSPVKVDATAKSDGEDVLSALIERMAVAVIGHVAPTGQ